MKEIKLYMCNFCHTQYKDANVCKTCEENHKTKLKVVEKIYKPFKDDCTGLPIKIVIEDSTTGKKFVYDKRGELL